MFAEMMGGMIGLESEEGEGTTFTVTHTKSSGKLMTKDLRISQVRNNQMIWIIHIGH